MSTDFSTGASHEPVASCATAFACLLRLSSQLCSDGEGGSVYCRGVVEGDSLPLSRLVEFAGQLGLEAKHARSNWQGLQAIGFKHSILALLKNTNLVLLTGTRPSVGEAVAAWDPLDRHGGVQFVQRENFEAVWTGDVVIITTRILRKSEAPNRLDFCWLTPTGLQLLGRKSDNRQRLKLFHRASDDTGVQYTAAARNARQQAESVLARDSGSEPSVTAGTAMQASSWPPLAALTGRGEWRRWIIRLYLPAAAILAIGSTGLFLLGYPAAGILAVAVNAATKGSEDVPNSGSSGDHATMRGADRLPENARRLRSANAACSPPSLPNTLPTQAALRIGPPPEVAIPAPALPDPPAVEAAGIPSGSTAKTSSGSARASLATSAPPATTAAPTGSGDPATLSKDPLPATAAANPAPVASAAPAAAAASAAAMPAPTEPSGEPRIPAAEMATLLARGDALLSTGDTTSARLFYQRAADAGAGLAAVRLGETFDPAFLDRAHLRGARGDPGQAVSWYRRALDLGVTDAEVLLKALRNN